MSEEYKQDIHNDNVSKAREWAKEFLNPGQFFRIKKYHNSDKVFLEIVGKKDTWKKIKSFQ